MRERYGRRRKIDHDEGEAGGKMKQEAVKML